MNFLSLFKRNLIYKFKKKIDIDLEKLDHLSLDDLFLHFGTDKSNSKKNEELNAHGYTNFYKKHLDSFKNKQIKILEIGAFSGASAAAFAKYFPNSEIYCIDINISNFKYQSKKIHVFGINSSDNKMVLKFLEKINFYESIKHFDIIIDDGSHKLSDQLNALNFFYKLVAKGGFYIIEDYKFPNYFKHLNDVNDIKIDELIKKVNQRVEFSSSLISINTINDLISTNKKIYEYKGNTDISNISFFEKKI